MPKIKDDGGSLWKRLRSSPGVVGDDVGDDVDDLLHGLCGTAGDVGGYLGLLIGGSVLTVIEIVDLVFYNSFMRCCKRQ